MQEVENNVTVDPPGDDPRLPVAVPPPLPAGGEEAQGCPRCHADLSRAAAARFCSRCGFNLRPGEPLAVLPFGERADEFQARLVITLPASPPATPFHWLRAHLPFPLVTRRHVAAAGDRHSLILLGYANAMYRLGWRYETGEGAARNVNEAVRCYFKAAKLGNEPALARLAPKCVPEASPAGDAQATLS